MTKASILLLYGRLFSVRRYILVICRIMFVVIVAYGIASTALSIWQCTRKSRIRHILIAGLMQKTAIVRAWDRQIPGKCINLAQQWQVIDTRRRLDN